MDEKLKNAIANLPDSPGVYLYSDQKDKLLYVGKAKNLKKRVSSYFYDKAKDPKTEALVQKIESVSTIVTTTEAEALLLEDSLIKKHKPPYNIDLKDNKNYPYFRLSVGDKYPMLTVVRKRIKDGAKYFGPYSGSITDALKNINRLFLLRKCSELPKKACLYLQLGQCLAPCVKEVDQDYSRETERLIDFLKGGYEKVINSLKAKMAEDSNVLAYEKAAETRDKLKILERIAANQKIIAPDLADRDIWHFAENNEFVAAIVLIMQNGRIVGSREYAAAVKKTADEAYFERLLISYYNQEEVFPDEVILPDSLDRELLVWLKSKTKVHAPQSGFRYELLGIARRNALQILQKKILLEGREALPQKGLFRLQEIFNLIRQPQRIDCFDISHIQGSETVASMTVLRDGVPAKDQYRKYIIDLESPDDFRAMEEVLSRRYIRVAEGEAERPDLIVIDGGKGQLSIAARVLKAFGLDIPVISIAKKNEELFVPGRANPIVLKRSDPALRLIQTVRDEAHRFAITFHRQRRSKRTLNS